MNGPQDLGGQMGFGPIAPEANEPLFHAEWEKRAMGMTVAAGTMGHWTIDESRFQRESLAPVDYYASSYYEIWIKALEGLLARHGFVDAEELIEGRAANAGTKPKRVLKAGEVAGVLAKGFACDRPVEAQPRFAVGDKVRTSNRHPDTHTRLPRYARDKPGTVEAVHGGYVFPDVNAHGGGEAPQHLYTVVFDGRTLWGEDCEEGLSVSVDAWESYLEPAA